MLALTLGVVLIGALPGQAWAAEAAEAALQDEYAEVADYGAPEAAPLTEAAAAYPEVTSPEVPAMTEPDAYSETVPQEGTPATEEALPQDVDPAISPAEPSAAQPEVEPAPEDAVAAEESGLDVPSEQDEQATQVDSVDSAEADQALADQAPTDSIAAKVDATLDSQATPDSKDSATLPTNAFAIESGVAYGMLAEVAGGSTANKANVRLYRSNNTNAQFWKLEAYKNGYYIVNVKSGKVLDVADGKAQKGANVWQYTKNGSKAQLWTLVASNNGGWVLKSLLGSNLVLDLAGGKATNGANLRLWSANGTAAQTFWFREKNPAMDDSARVIEDGAYFIATSKDETKVLDVKGGSTTKGANIQLYASNGTNAQRFYASYAGGYYTFQNAISGLVLDVSGASPIAGANVQLYTPNHSTAQQWRVERGSDGLYTLINRGTGLTLDVQGGKTANSTNIDGYYANGTAAQKWVLTSVGMLADGFYTIADATGKILDVRGASLANGAAVQRHGDNGTLAQRFRLDVSDEAGGNYYTIRNVNSAQYVAASGSSVVQQKNRSVWKLELVGTELVFSNGGTYLKFDANDKAALGKKAQSAKVKVKPTKLICMEYVTLKTDEGRFVDIKGGSRSVADVVAVANDTDTSRVWRVVEKGNAYAFINIMSGLSLGATNAGAVRQVRYRYEAQEWTVDWDEVNGGLVLTNVASGKVLDAAGAAVSAAATRSSAAEAKATQSFRIDNGKQISLKERMAQVAEHFAEHNAHGYSQVNRGAGKNEVITIADGTKVTISSADVDCSELVRQVANSVIGFNKISYMWTGDEDAKLTKNGWKRIKFSKDAVLRGDILWMSGHTGVALGYGKQSEAYADENNDIYGHKQGDNNGREVLINPLSTNWTYIYRYVG